MENKMHELMEMVSEEVYKENYVYGIFYIKSLIESYEEECIQKKSKNPIKRVDYRLKTAKSIADKLRKKGYGISRENAIRYLSDLAGVRVVCLSEKDVYDLERFLCGCQEIAIIKRKDYIRLPKANGYQSLHLIAEFEIPGKMKTIRVEIQLRTREMHCWAEADHKLCYKSR